MVKRRGEGAPMHRSAPEQEDEVPSIRLVHVMTTSFSLLQFLRGQVAFVRNRGFEIHAIASPDEGLERFHERDGVPVHPVAMPRDIQPVADLIALIRMVFVLRGLRPDIVQAGTPQGGLIGMLAARAARVPVRIYHIRGLPLMTATGRRRQLLRWTEVIACRCAHRVLCVSHSIREVAIAEGLCPAEKIVVLCGGSGNGVDSTGHFNPDLTPASVREDLRQRLGIPSDAPVIGFVGRLMGIKGTVELEGAWRLLRDQHPDLHLIVAGPEEQHDPVPPEVIANLRADPRVHLTGKVDDPLPIYAAIDVLLFPSKREGLPNVLLEASAMAVPGVASAVPGCIDVIEDGVTGLLVPPDDIVAMASAVERYLRDPVLRRSHGEAARERVMQVFRQEAIWEALVAEYNALLQQKRIARPVYEAVPLPEATVPTQ